MFAIAHVGTVPYHPVERGPLFELPWNTLQPALAYTWNIGAIEVALALAAVLGVTAVWRTGPKLRRVWPAVAAGGVLLAFGLASFGVAFANHDYRRIHQPTDCLRCVPTSIQENLARKFNRGINPTLWWIGGELAAGAGVIFLGAAVAARRARTAS
jgi:hypothetical protein